MCRQPKCNQKRRNQTPKRPRTTKVKILTATRTGILQKDVTRTTRTTDRTVKRTENLLPDAIGTAIAVTVVKQAGVIVDQTAAGVIEIGGIATDVTAPALALDLYHAPVAVGTGTDVGVTADLTGVIVEVGAEVGATAARKKRRKRRRRRNAKGQARPAVRTTPRHAHRLVRLRIDSRLLIQQLFKVQNLAWNKYLLRCMR